MHNCITYLKNNSVVFQNIVSKLSKVVKFFKQSGCQSLLNFTLKKYLSVRWNSVLFIFESVYKNFDNLIEILIEKEKNFLMENIKKNEILEILNFLKIFYEATKNCEGFSCSTTYLSLLWYFKIENYFKNSLTDNKLIKDFKNIIYKYFQINFKPNKILYVALFCFPIYKNAQYLAMKFIVKY